MYNPRFEKDVFKRDVRNNVKTLFRKEVEEATPQQLFQAVSYAVKEAIIDDWLATQKQYEKDDPKTVYYMSMEFLLGRALGNNLINMTAYKEVKEALEEMGIDLNVIEDQEPDPALGNGGLGRLAACFLDSLATLGYASYGCGIRYRYGMFKQKIRDGYQVEAPDNWLKDGNPFELRRPEYAKEVRFGGNIRVEYDETGKTHFVQENYESVMAIPYDYPIVGYGNHIVNTLRIWDAEAIVDFQLDSFDRGDYHKAVEQENLAKNIVEVLYPNDNHIAGKELRLKQQYFFVSASIQAAITKFKKKHGDISKLPEKVTFQMNDTHPTVAVAELMRILLDEENLGWNEAWDITTKCCAYTNHTIMAEALEKWPIDLFSRLLPRIYQIIQEIDRRFVEQVRVQYPGNEEKVKKMAILMDGQVKMAHLAIVAGYSVNGVAKLHTEILKNQELKDFYQMMPEKFNNKTNGITQRRFLMHANPLLADWVTEKLGTKEWITDLSKMSGLKEWLDDEEALKEFMTIKFKNKERLAAYIKEHNGVEVDPRSIFDVQVKRLAVPELPPVGVGGVGHSDGFPQHVRRGGAHGADHEFHIGVRHDSHRGNPRRRRYRHQRKYLYAVSAGVAGAESGRRGNDGDAARRTGFRVDDAGRVSADSLHPGQSRNDVRNGGGRYRLPAVFPVGEYVHASGSLCVGQGSGAACDHFVLRAYPQRIRPGNALAVRTGLSAFRSLGSRTPVGRVVVARRLLPADGRIDRRRPHRLYDPAVDERRQFQYRTGDETGYELRSADG